MNRNEKRKEIAIKLGKLLREQRKNRHYTHDQITELFDISHFTIKAIEHGTIETNWILLLQLCAFFEVDLNQFAKDNLLNDINDRHDNLCIF